MKYEKPQVMLIGDATEKIQSVGKQPHMPSDNQPNSTRLTLPAYEADE